MNKSIFDPSFRYAPSYDTDLRKTFERIRRERAVQNGDTVSLPAQAENVRRLNSRKVGPQ